MSEKVCDTLNSANLEQICLVMLNAQPYLLKICIDELKLIKFLIYNLSIAHYFPQTNKSNYRIGLIYTSIVEMGLRRSEILDSKKR